MLTKEDIVRGLKELGLEEGATVLVHSSLSSFGHVEGGAEAVVDALLEAVGPRGTVVVPTFATSDPVFDPAASVTPLGAIPEALRRRPGAVRSQSPLASVAALGGDAEALCAGHDVSETAHAEGTPYLRIVERDGYVLLLGVDQDRSTLLHTAEELLRAPYLKRASRPILRDGRPHEVTYDFFPGPHRDFIGLDKALRRRGVVRLGQIGPCVVRLMKAKDLVKAVMEMLREDPAAVLCKNPACEDCVRQRADLRRHRLAEEAFTLAAQSQLAGRYPAEIADRIARCGLAAVEIDQILGRDLLGLGERDRQDLKSRLDACDVRVVSVRFRAVPEEMDRAAEVCRALGAPMVVLPSSAPRAALEAVAGAGLTPALENVAMGTQEMGRRLEAAADLGVRCAFNPAEFARVGVNPFLGAYRRPVRKHVGLLYVCDGLRDGRPTRLARGHGEIKEMVSILRCASFGGPMVLCGRPGGLERRAGEFMALLESL